MKILFEDDGTVLEVPAGTALVDVCDHQSTPLLFGCRNALCGTCLVEATAAPGATSPPGPDEAELLSVLAPGNARARLACQLKILGDMKLRGLG